MASKLISSVFLPSNSLYQSLDSNAHHLNDEESAIGQSPFIANPHDIPLTASTSTAALSPTPRASSNARSMIRPHTALRNDLFEVEEDLASQGVEASALRDATMPKRGRQRERRIRLPTNEDDPPASLLFEASGARQRSISPSHSTSPPPDFTRHTPTADTKGKGKATSVDETEIDTDPQSPPSHFTTQSPSSQQSTTNDLHVGGARSWASLRPYSRRNQPGLSRRQRALWLWVNVEDLDAFLTDVYTYYVGKGIYCITLERLINLLTAGFVISFSTFLLGCIDYSIIRQKHTLSDVIVDRCISRFHPFTLFLVLLFSGMYAWRAVQFGRAIKRMWSMHEFFEELLGIPETDIQTAPWHVVVTRLAALRSEHPASNQALQDPASSNHPARLDAHDVANRVMRETNYMIALFNRDVLDFTVPWPPAISQLLPSLKSGTLTKALEWNVTFCLMRYLFGSDGKVKRAFLGSGNRDLLVQGLQRRFILMGFVNAILAPFIVIYLLFYSFFRYFEEYHKNPSSLGSRSFTEMAKWRFREYNELPHIFKQRMDQAHAPAQTYLDRFPKERTALVSSFIAFVAGSFASVLILFSLLDPDAFLHFEVTKDRSVLFYIGVFGTILAVARGMVPDDHKVTDPEKLMLEVAEHTHWLPDEWKGRLHSTQVHDAFSSLFQMKITTFSVELFSVLTTPFVLWYTLPRCAPQIIDFFREFSIHVDGLGYVCSFGVFDFKRRGGEAPSVPRMHSPTGYGNTTNEGKLDKSLLNFKSNYPEWNPREETTSLYLSNLQTHMPAFGKRSTMTRFGNVNLGSTTLMADSSMNSRDQDARARLYERAFQKAGGKSISRYKDASAGVEEESVEEGYADERIISSPGPVSASSLASPDSLTASTMEVRALKFTDASTIECFQTLSDYDLLSPASSSLSLRNTVDAKLISGATSFLNAFEQVNAQLDVLQSHLDAMNVCCKDVEEKLTKANVGTEFLLQHANGLRSQKAATSIKQSVIESFLARFTLAPDELQALTAASVPVGPSLFKALDKTLHIRQDCQVLLTAVPSSAQDQQDYTKAGMDIMQSTSNNLDLAYAKLQKYALFQVRGFTRAEGEVSPLLRDTIARLKDREEMFREVTDVLASTRSAALLSHFNEALTRGGPSGLPRPIELHAHDPIRYVGDMLAWIHQAMAGEREFLESFFSLKEDQRFPGAPRKQPDEKEHDELQVRSLMDRDLEACGRPLKLRIQQTIQSQEGALMAYRISSLVAFYNITIERTIGQDALMSKVLVEISELALQAFYATLDASSRSLLRFIQPVSSDLSPPLALRDILTSLREIMEVYQAALSDNSSSSSSLPLADFDQVLSRTIDPAEEMCEKMVENSKVEWDKSVFMLNCLSFVKAVLEPFQAFTENKLDEIEKKLHLRFELLVTDHLQTLLKESGLGSLTKALADGSKDQPMTSQHLASAAPVTSTIEKFNAFLSTSLLSPGPRLNLIASTRIAAQIQHEALIRLYEDYCKIYEVAASGNEGYDIQLCRTPAEIATLFGIEPSEMK